MLKFRRYLIEEMRPFIMTVSGSTFTIPTYGSLPGVYNYDVEVVESSQTFTGQTGNCSITFPVDGLYTIKISGLFPRICFSGGSEAYKLKSIEQWGDIEWNRMEDAFYGCSNMIYNANDIPNLTNVISMRSMFRNCTLFNADVSHWNVSNVQNMNQLFSNCYNFNSDISLWNVSSVTDMSSMFRGCYIFNSDISAWDTSNVLQMGGMFMNAYLFNSNISSWDVSNVTSMYRMFTGAKVFNQDISNWDTSSVSNMGEMFSYAKVFNQDISNWDTSNVTNMSYMFTYATSFNQDLSGWCVSLIPSLPQNFATGATAWVLPKPVWGTCP